MLKTRILTAICLLPLVLGGLFLPHFYFMLLIALIVFLSGLEYARMIWPSRALIPCTLFLASLLILYGIGQYMPVCPLLVGALFWLFAAVWVCVFPRGQVFWSGSLGLKVLTGLSLIVPAGVGLTALQATPQGWRWVLMVLLIVWSADIGAYFAGRSLGKRLLAPQVSPKKTRAGVVGGFILVCLVMTLYFYALGFKTPLLLNWLGLSAIGFVCSVFGDLVESAIKRCVGVKDSGNLLPGHGGLLDRIDSLLSTTPYVALLLFYTPLTFLMYSQ